MVKEDDLYAKGILILLDGETKRKEDDLAKLVDSNNIIDTTEV